MSYVAIQIGRYLFHFSCFNVASLGGGCDNRVTEPEQAELEFSYYDRSTQGAFHTNPKSLKTQSAAGPAYGCFVNAKINGAWKYWSIVLDYPKAIIGKAKGKRVKANFRVTRPGIKKLTRLANCIIRATDRAHQMLQKLMKGVQNIEVVSPRKMIKDGESISGCKVYEDGYWCPENTCFTDEGNCQGDGGLSLPIVVVKGGGANDDGNLGGGDPGGDPNDPPPPRGGDDPGDGPGGGPCRSCGPGDDPCGSNQKDKPEGCEQEQQLDPNKPCEGDPVENPTIAAQNYSGVEGGRYGWTRSNGNQFHGGVDIANEVGNNWYAMYGGTVVGRGTLPSLGNYITIQVNIDGTYYHITYGHLQENGRSSLNAKVSAGDLIGKQGLSGNLEEAIRQGYALEPHSHIIAKERIGSGWSHKDDFERINPEDILKTQFDNQGNPIDGTGCSE